MPRRGMQLWNYGAGAGNKGGASPRALPQRTLIKAASSVKATLRPNGNLRFVVNAGRAIGYDFKVGGPTSFYTVITDRSRNLITAFPGL